MKRIVTFLLAVVMCIGVAVPVYAEEAACPGADALHTLKTCTDWTEISKKDALERFKNFSINIFVLIFI